MTTTATSTSTVTSPTTGSASTQYNTLTPEQIIIQDQVIKNLSTLYLSSSIPITTSTSTLNSSTIRGDQPPQEPSTHIPTPSASGIDFRLLQQLVQETPTSTFSEQEVHEAEPSNLWDRCCDCFWTRTGKKDKHD